MSPADTKSSVVRERAETPAGNMQKLSYNADPGSSEGSGADDGGADGGGADGGGGGSGAGGSGAGGGGAGGSDGTNEPPARRSLAAQLMRVGRTLQAAAEPG